MADERDDDWGLFGPDPEGARGHDGDHGHDDGTGPHHADQSDTNEFAGGLFHDDDPAQRAAPRRRIKRRIGKALWALVALVVLVGIVAGVVVGVRMWQQQGEKPTDWAGVGQELAVVRVQAGDGLLDVGVTLAQAGVVASATTFVTAAKASGKLKALQPGYYAVHVHSSAKAVVAELADPKNRLGRLRIIPGQTLADKTVVSTTGETSTRAGIISAITAACVPTGGKQACFSTDDLWEVEKTATPAELGVVGWAVDAVKEAPDPTKRLEGLILPGDYDIAPGSTAKEALFAVVSGSAARWNTTNIVSGAQSLDMTPYQAAIVASLAQSEANDSDMSKVARVIYNRLAQGKKLEFDSTVNYGLNRAQISTTNEERLDPKNLYSTYAHAGLPPTPIGAPGPKSIDAATDPAVGDWIYFVAIDLQGHTCFSVTAEQHQACVEKARANGVFG